MPPGIPGRDTGPTPRDVPGMDRYRIGGKIAMLVSQAISIMRSISQLNPIVFTVALVLPGCTTEEGPNESVAKTCQVQDAESCDVDTQASFPAVDESACAPQATDYQPQADPDGDGWPACVTDDGAYHLIDTTPSSIARVTAFDQIIRLLGEGCPTPDAFTEARTAYAQDEGLESRVLRREDLFFPAIPEAEWDPGVDADKQCTVEANVSNYPERCAGPARIVPLLNEAFAAGQMDEGDAAVNAARIEAGLLWFLHLSVFKEANTCLAKAKDCDSSWAYYTGGFDRAGGLGLSSVLRGLSDFSHQRIWDGFTAVRCWRELYPIEMYPDLASVPEEGQRLLDNAYDQLSRALWYGWARLVRDHIEQQPQTCDSSADANWAFLQVVGPVLSEEVQRRDASKVASLDALWQRSEPPALEELRAAVDTIDTVFPCP